jgi:D-lactate dehydrogenase
MNMRIAVFSTKKWTRDAFDRLNADFGFEFSYFEAHLCVETAPLVEGYDAVCVFVNDDVNARVLEIIHAKGIRIVALRCAGFNNVDLEKAAELDMCVMRVPAYSPHAVAEHTIGLILDLNRKIHRAYNRVRDGNFALDGLLGFDLYRKTVGVIGTGKIGTVLCDILQGFGVRILAHDNHPNDRLREQGVEYVDLKHLYSESDIITLHCPLTFESYHMINDYAIALMKENVMIVNTSRGPLIDTNAVIEAMKQGRIGYLGLDVYEEEADLFFEDLSDQVIQDDTFTRLLTLPNVTITAHQAFFTREAVDNIALTTLQNLRERFETGTCANCVMADKVVRHSTGGPKKND